MSTDPAYVLRGQNALFAGDCAPEHALLAPDTVTPTPAKKRRTAHPLAALPAPLDPSERDLLVFLSGYGPDYDRAQRVVERFYGGGQVPSILTSPLEQLRTATRWHVQGRIDVPQLLGNIPLPPPWPTAPSGAVVLVLPYSTSEASWRMYEALISPKVRDLYAEVGGRLKRTGGWTLAHGSAPTWRAVDLPNNEESLCRYGEAAAVPSACIAAALALFPKWAVSLLATAAM